jgi:hypothetical protein
MDTRMANFIKKLKADNQELHGPEYAEIVDRLYKKIFPIYHNAMHGEMSRDTDPGEVMSAVHNLLVDAVGYLIEVYVPPPNRLRIAKDFTDHLSHRVLNYFSSRNGDTVAHEPRLRQ